MVVMMRRWTIAVLGMIAAVLMLSGSEARAQNGRCQGRRSAQTSQPTGLQIQRLIQQQTVLGTQGQTSLLNNGTGSGQLQAQQLQGLVARQLRTLRQTGLTTAQLQALIAQQIAQLQAQYAQASPDLQALLQLQISQLLLAAQQL